MSRPLSISTGTGTTVTTTALDTSPTTQSVRRSPVSPRHRRRSTLRDRNVYDADRTRRESRERAPNAGWPLGPQAGYEMQHLPAADDLNADADGHDARQDLLAADDSNNEADGNEARHEGEPEFRYTAIDTPTGYPALDYRPTLLQPAVTISLVVLYLTIIGGMIALIYCSDENQTYAVSNLNVYLAARYGPSLVGTVTTVLVRLTIKDLCRMLPYLKMADPKPGRVASCRAKESVAAYYFPTFGTYTSTARAILCVQLITGPLTSVKLGLLQVVAQDEGWSVVVHRGIAYALMGYYGVQSLALVAVTVKLWSRQTGLRADWDPTSLADIIAMFSHFNVDVSKVPLSLNTLRLANIWHEYRFRLGYWKRWRPDKPEDVAVVYGVRATEIDDTVQYTLPARPFGRTKQDKHSLSPYRGLPVLGFGRWNRLVVWILGAGLMLLLVGVAVVCRRSHIFTIRSGSIFEMANSTLQASEVEYANMTLAGTWSFLDGPKEDIGLLALWNFILRMLPVYIANIAINLSIFMNSYYLYAQPLTDMYAGPCPAEESILLDYQTPSSLDVILQSWKFRHWKVLYFAVLELAGPLAQLAPVGVLTLSAHDHIVYGRISPGMLGGTVAILFIYSASMAFGYFSAKRRFPRDGTSLIDLWLMCHKSRLAEYPEFRECGPDWTKEDLNATLQLRHNGYLMGICKSDDGVGRVGFDVAEVGRQKARTNAVSFVDPDEPTRTSHCHLCLYDENYHEKKADAAKLTREQYYGRHTEPIADVFGLDARRAEDDHGSLV